MSQEELEPSGKANRPVVSQLAKVKWEQFNLCMIALVHLHIGNRRMRRHSAKTIRKLAGSIAKFGFVRPILIDKDHNIIDGHALVEAALKLGLKEVPAIVVDHLNTAEIKALKIALNRLQEEGVWDEPVLRDEFQSILELDDTFELEVTGFELPEIDRITLLGEEDEASTGEVDPADVLPEASSEPAITQLGDRFVIGPHILYCGDACDLRTLEHALGGETADVVFTDPPYNVRIQGNVSGLGTTKHREFVEASGEMSPEKFGEFLRESLSAAAANCRDGAVLYVCMDWRSIELLLRICAEEGLTLLNLCVWVKFNGGMGSFYRSQHELVAVLRKGDTSHINNVQLGQYGRYRTNVWHYAGLNAFGADRQEQLSAHPTVKPVALVRDAILDSTNRGDLVLDPFGGSGTTMIAAEKAKRRSCLVELDPLYCDLIIRRFQQQFGAEAIHDASGLTFAQLAEQRRQKAEAPSTVPAQSMVAPKTDNEIRETETEAFEVTEGATRSCEVRGSITADDPVDVGADAEGAATTPSRPALPAPPLLPAMQGRVRTRKKPAYSQAHAAPTLAPGRVRNRKTNKRLPDQAARPPINGRIRTRKKPAAPDPQSSSQH